VAPSRDPLVGLEEEVLRVSETPEASEGPDQDDSLDEGAADDQYLLVADLLRSCRQAMLNIVEEHQWRLALGSQAISR
jgi:hypothetical protein